MNFGLFNFRTEKMYNDISNLLFTFSIIIPTYNSEKDIFRCLSGLASQTFQNFEIIVVDACSTDGTIQLINSFAGIFGERLRIISEKDSGIYDAMNKGLAISVGEWIYFLGSDDELSDNSVLFDITRAIKESKINVVYGDVKIIGKTSWANNGDVYDGPFDLKKILLRNISHQAIFYRHSFIENEIGKFNIKYRICADWDLNWRCWAKTQFHYIRRVVANFRGGGESTKNFEDNMFFEDTINNIVSYFNLSYFDPLLNPLKKSHTLSIIEGQKKENLLKYYSLRILNKLDLFANN